MSVNPCGPTNTINTGCGNDNVHISKADGLLGLLGYNKVDINGHVQYMTNEQLSHTQFNLGAGNDTLVVDSNVTANIHANGGSGSDVMIGGSGNDHFQGGSGDDLLAGRGGNDHLEGGRGDDILLGGNGHDHLDGGRGSDFLKGGNGFDILHGGPGWDFKDWS